MGDPVSDGSLEPVQRVAFTGEAADLVRRLTGMHGPVMFHQSGGCCDGSAPMCYPAGEFRTGNSDILLRRVPLEGLEEPVDFWMSRSQFEYWKHTILTVDVVKGRGSGFSLEGPEGVRFLIRSRLLTDEEFSDLEGLERDAAEAQRLDRELAEQAADG